MKTANPESHITQLSFSVLLGRIMKRAGPYSTSIVSSRGHWLTMIIALWELQRVRPPYAVPPDQRVQMGVHPQGPPDDSGQIVYLKKKKWITKNAARDDGY
jgi:hypothetical protein